MPQLSVSQFIDLVAQGQQRSVMGRHNQAYATSDQRLDLIQQEAGAGGVEVGGGLIGKKEVWGPDDCTGEGQTLFLSPA